MNDIVLLERFIRQRDTWKRKNPSSNKTDLQIIHWRIRYFWLELIVCGALLTHQPSRFPEYDAWDTCRFIFLLCASAAFIVALWKALKVQALFERYSNQNTEDIVRVIEGLAACERNEESRQPSAVSGQR